tara:strand:- start:247 stop:354 length:108 start_codon:yes stop_codon:yes gene_type:complete
MKTKIILLLSLIVIVVGCVPIENMEDKMDMIGELQ